MKCKNCQKEIDAGYKMCPYCGEPVTFEAVNQAGMEENTNSGAASIAVNALMPEDETENELIREEKTSAKKKSKKGLIIAITILLFAAAGALGYFFLLQSPLKQTAQKIEAATEIDPLALVELKNSNKYTLTVKDNQIKANVPGEYSVIYSLTNIDSNKNKDIIFKFTVVDTTPPEIIADETIKVPVGKEVYILSVITVNDIVDGAIDTKNVSVEGSFGTDTEGTYPLTLTVSDKAGNKASKTVNVVVEKQGDPNVFFENIIGYWENTATNSFYQFMIKNGTYYLSAYQPSVFDGIGNLTFFNLNSENTIASFIWDYTTYTIDSNRIPHYSAVTKITIIVDAGIPNDNKISINIGDGKGFQEYQYRDISD